MNCTRCLPVCVSLLLGAAMPLFQDPKPAPARIAPPSPEAVRSVWDFYYRGQGGGVVLADAKLCLDVGKEGPDKSEPAQELPVGGVKAGTTVHVWQAYLVPSGDAIEDLTLQLKLNGVLRESKSIGRLRGDGPRVRTWTSVTPKRAGKWTLEITRGETVLRSLALEVQ